MQIIREKEICGNLNTELFNLLNEIPENILHNFDHQLRHPIGIYGISTGKVFSAFEEVLKALINFNDFKELSIAHNDLLDSLMAYIDDSYHLMKTIFPNTSVNRRIVFADKWMMAVDKSIISTFKNQLEDYRHQLSYIVNKIKHQHARYCHIEMDTIYGKIRGYYIEGVSKEGVIVPDQEIHPLYNNMRSGISYNKDIKKYLTYFYFISNLISQTIYKLIYKHYGIKLKIGRHESEDDNRISNICNNVNKIKELYFPDEYSSEIPQITVHSNSKIEFRKSAYKTYIDKLPKYKTYKINLGLSGDGVSNEFALPYF